MQPRTKFSLLAVAGGLAAAAIIAQFTSSPTAAGTQQRAKPYSGHLVLDMQKEPIEDLVKERLRDPDSAQFGEMDLYDDRKFIGTDAQFVCGFVNAKNGFGGYGGQKGFIVMIKPIPAVEMQDDNGFHKQWHQLCAGTHTIDG